MVMGRNITIVAKAGIPRAVRMKRSENCIKWKLTLVIVNFGFWEDTIDCNNT